MNLVPSENRMSPLAMTALGTDYQNRYFFNQALDPGFWQFRGAQEVASIELEAQTILGELASAQHVNVRPISGMSAMSIALSGHGGEPGGHVVSIDEASGGHYATSGLARRLGFTTSTVPVTAGQVDTDRLTQILREHRPRLVYLDLQNSLHELDVRPIAGLIAEHSPETRLHVDCSHTLGLVLGGAFRNPLDDGADSMGGSTHKSFPGPHKGVLFTRSASVHEELADAQMAMLSTHHLADTLALALAAAEFRHFGPAYAAQVPQNAGLFASKLGAADFDVIGDKEVDYTQTHQVWVRVGDPADTDAFAAALYEQGVRVNVQVDLPGVAGPVLRLGVSELTFLGARGPAMEGLADEFVRARSGEVSDGEGGRRVRALCGEPFYFTEAWQ